MNRGKCEIQSQNLLNDWGKFSNPYLANLFIFIVKIKFRILLDLDPARFKYP